MFGKIYSVSEAGILDLQAKTRAAQTADNLSKMEIPDLKMIKVVGDKEVSLDTGIPIGNLISGSISQLAQFRDGRPFYGQENLRGETRNVSEFRAMPHGPFLIDSFTIASEVISTRAKLVYTLILDGRLKAKIDFREFLERLENLRRLSKKDDGSLFDNFRELAVQILEIDAGHKDSDLAEVYRKVTDSLVFDKD